MTDQSWTSGDQFAWAESPSIKRIFQARRQFALSLLAEMNPTKRTLRVLDAGCGDGYWTRFFSDLGMSVVGLDNSPLRLERAERACPGAGFICGDLTRIPASCGLFDLIWLSSVIEHIPDDTRLLWRLRYSLKPGGRLVVLTPNEGGPTQDTVWRRRARKHSDHVHFYREEEITGKLAATGWKISRVYREIAYPYWDWLYYWLSRRDWGFALLEWLAKVWPGACSDYWFVCRREEEEKHARP